MAAMRVRQIEATRVRLPLGVGGYCGGAAFGTPCAGMRGSSDRRRGSRASSAGDPRVNRAGEERLAAVPTVAPWREAVRTSSPRASQVQPRGSKAHPRTHPGEGKERARHRFVLW